MSFDKVYKISVVLVVFIYIQSAHLILGGIAGVLFLDIAEAICDGDAELAGFVLREHIRQHVVHPDACLVTLNISDAFREISSRSLKKDFFNEISNVGNGNDRYGLY